MQERSSILQRSYIIMRVASVFIFLVVVMSAKSETGTIALETKMELAKGSIILKAGTAVEIVSGNEKFVNIVYRNLKGRVLLSAVTRTDPSIKLPEATSDVAPAPTPSRRPASAPAPAQAPKPAKVVSPTAAPLSDQIKLASDKLGPALKKAERLTLEGQLDEANAGILATFPEATRTAAEKLVLGNLFFGMLPDVSYKLHQEAAEELPDAPDALLEWALEQHRAKEYKGAAATYESYSKLRPNHASAFGLAAECAIRLGNVEKAVSLWNASEKATRGTLEQLETLVCEVNGRLPKEPVRIQWMRAMEKGDQRAAEALITLDSAWETDWWNTGPSFGRLEHDLALVKRIIPAPEADLRAALCVAECALKVHQNAKADVRELIASSGFFFDDKTTLPMNGKVLSQMLSFALLHTSLDRESGRAKFGERILANARNYKDADMYNAAAHLYLNTDKLREIDQEGWDNTHDARFAASRVLTATSLSDPLLQRALKEFPENSEIVHVAVRLVGADESALRPYLIQGIKAEYTKLSVTRIDFPRPSAFVLRGYFMVLARLQSRPGI